MISKKFNLQPPDDYCDLSIVPTIAEIKSNNKPFIRPIPERGPFRYINDLFDVHFRLLKEDATRPLREGCNLMKKLC